MNGKKTIRMEVSCYCGSSKSFNQCCGLVHKHQNKAKTAEALMRSRYSAFVVANGDYLLMSHYHTSRPIHEISEIVHWTKSVTWLRLEIHNATKGNITDTEGTVEFKAFYKEDGEVEVIHENSFFKKEKGIWFYVGSA